MPIIRYNNKELSAGRYNGKQLTIIRRNGLIVWQALTFTLEPVVSQPMLGAGGAEAEVSAHLKTYRQGVLLRVETVCPVVSGSGEGFTVSGNVVTAANRGTSAGAERSLALSLTYTFTHLGKPQMLSTQAAVCQAANSASYGAVTISGGTAADIPAGGGTVSAASGVSASQSVTFTSGASRAGVVLIGFSASVTAPSLSTTAKARTKAGTLTATATGEGGKTATKTIDVYQAANMIETYAAPVVTLGEVEMIPASGGATPRISAAYAQQAIYTSGETASITSGAAVTVPVPVTAPTKGTTISDVTYFGDCVLRVALNGKNTDTLVPLYQAGNYVIGADLHSIYARYRVVSPAGETISPATGSTTTFRFTSGATLDATPSGGTRITTKQLYTLAADAGKPWVKSLDAATGALTLDGMGVLEGERDTPAITRTLQVKFIHDSGFTPPVHTVLSNEATGTSVCTQGTNRIERYEALAVSVNYGQAQEGIIGAIPETDISATAVFTSGAKKSVDVKAATTIVYSKNTSDDWFSVTSGGGVNFTNNTSTEERTAQNGVRAVATAVLLGKTLTATTYATVTQAAGRQVFGQMDISSFAVEVPAAGGLSSDYAVFTVSHPWTWNGVAGSGATLQFTGASVPAAYTVSYSATYTGQHLGTTTKARTALGTTTLTISRTPVGSSPNASATCTVYQSANTSTIGAVALSGGAVSDIPAGGGTVSAMTGLSATQSVTFTSGASCAGAVSVSYSAAVSAPSLGLTEKVRTKVGTLTATATGEGSKTATKTLDVYQAANVRSLMGCYIVDDNGGTTAIPASGKTVALTPRAVYGYTAGVSQDVDVSTAAEFVGRSIWSLADGSAYTTLTTPSGRNTATIAVAGRGTSVGAARMVSVVLTLPAGSESKSANTAYQQAANAAAYGAVTISGGTAADIPAAGGTVSAASGVSTSQSVTFTSGASRAGAVSVSYSGSVTAASLNTTVKARTKAGTLTATATGEGSKTATKAIDVYQAANTRRYENFKAELYYGVAPYTACGLVPDLRTKIDEVYTSGAVRQSDADSYVIRKTYTKNSADAWFRIQTANGAIDIDANPSDYPRASGEGIKVVVAASLAGAEHNTTTYGTVQQNGRKIALNSLAPQEEAQATNETTVQW